MQTQQTQFWQSEFGAEYTERNKFSVDEQDALYVNEYGHTRTAMNKEFLVDLEIGSILEVGCNVANQLRCLQSMGYNQLYGIELQAYAVEKVKEITKGINVIQGSGFDIPFKDSYFDLVFTSGVLIHISPDDINTIMDEMYRTSNQFIWGFEYYSDTYSEIPYRGNSNKMWKANFMQLFLNRFPDLEIVKEKKYPYQYNDNIDQMFLLRKKA
ncbi:pseudaminic acid biosynthesis-associated methylase [Paenibacillus agricola]|uniref:Methyltransferase domain-containing protein n=1 Tax=Paenibacillus agricola TaxID=2716264 RepID=A0ABX0JBK4_9BACL|nr:pseudaminic acid biosynthesis-associated methylase [Paenibacillus agricola]NHN33875.1 methyltransferase domain-containing protein [Paenibacillus agricola]